MKGLNYWILGLIYIVGIAGIFANCAAQCDPKYNYAYLLESGGVNEPDLYCTKYFIDNTLIKKAKMPLRFCYLKNNHTIFWNHQYNCSPFCGWRLRCSPTQVNVKVSNGDCPPNFAM